MYHERIQIEIRLWTKRQVVIEIRESIQNQISEGSQKPHMVLVSFMF